MLALAFAATCTAFLQLSRKPTLATAPRRSGLLTIGPRFGGAIDDAARYFKQACDQVGGPRLLGFKQRLGGWCR